MPKFQPPSRHPSGRRCGDPFTILTVLVLMPYAIIRHGIDTMRTRGK